MQLMEGQDYSTAFRAAYPKFNGLIWGYHWLQVGLYEPLVTGGDQAARQAGVAAAVTRFRQMLEDAPEHMPRVMPMTAAIAPTFAARYPEAAIIFDNLHAMHDVISDILASPRVPRERKRAEILTAAARYRDDTSFISSEQEWRAMAAAMGVQNMGGPVTGLLAEWPQPTLPRGAVMAGAEHAGMDHAAMTQPAAAAPGGMAGMDHSAMDHAAAPPAAMAPAPSPVTASAGGSQSDSAAVAAAVSAFHAALAAGYSAAALALLTDDALIVEAGETETREQYRAHHLPADIEFARSVETEQSPLRVRVSSDAAWVTSTSRSRGSFHGRAIDSEGAELMVLARSPAGWRIAAIHWSSHPRRP
jgi:ketosteroid isomerase-like protein